MKCPTCKARLSATALICGVCGTQLTSHAPDRQDDLDELCDDLAKRYTDGEAISIAGIVFWNVTRTQAKRAGLANDPGPRMTDLALGYYFGAAGVLAGRMFDKDKASKHSCDLGIVAVGSRRVFLLKLGRVSMRARSVPKGFKAKKVIAFRPLKASGGDGLRIRVLGKAPVRSDSAFTADGRCLEVKAPTSDTEGLSVGSVAVANAISNLPTFPLPEDVIASLVAMESVQLAPATEAALTDHDYILSFVADYCQQNEDMRRALILAARVGPASLKALIAECVRRPYRKPGNRYLQSAVGIICLLFAALFVAGGASGFAGSMQKPSDLGPIITVFATVVPAFLCFGLWMFYMAWGNRAYRLDRRLLAEGGGFGGTLDAFLALLPAGMNWQVRTSWNEIDSAAKSNMHFAKRLSEILRRMKEANRNTFLTSSPPELRNTLFRTKLQTTNVTIRYLGLWLPCLGVGIYYAVRGYKGGSPSVGDWALFVVGIIFGFGGGIPAIVLVIVQLNAWRSRRAMRRVFREEGLQL
jgi:hypothetical protein